MAPITEPYRHNKMYKLHMVTWRQYCVLEFGARAEHEQASAVCTHETGHNGPPGYWVCIRAIIGRGPHHNTPITLLLLHTANASSCAIINLLNH